MAKGKKVKLTDKEVYVEALETFVKSQEKKECTLCFNHHYATSICALCIKNSAFKAITDVDLLRELTTKDEYRKYSDYHIYGIWF